MICKVCGWEAPEGAKFCEKCGNTLATEAEEIAHAVQTDTEYSENPVSFDPKDFGLTTEKSKLPPLAILWIITAAMIVIGTLVRFGLGIAFPAKVEESVKVEVAQEVTPETEEVETEEDEPDLLDEAEAEKEDEPDLLDEAETEKEEESVEENSPEPIDFSNVTTDGFTEAPPGSWIQVLVDELDLMSANTIGWDNFICYATKNHYYPVLQSYYDSRMNMTWYQLGPNLWTLAPNDWLVIHFE